MISRLNLSLWSLLAIYAIGRVLQTVPDEVPTLLIVALHVLPPLAFAVIHGSVVCRPRDIAVFVFLCFVVGNVFENLSILTGFPFGHYHFTGVMGPKLLQVPVLLACAYVGMGYLSWTLAGLILGRAEDIARSRVLTQPLIAAFLMVVWDFSMDPAWANIAKAWIWHQGGPYFGVPVSNFFGWYLTTYSIYQLFALYLRRYRVKAKPVPMNLWRIAIAYYGAFAIGNLLFTAPRGLSVVTDAAGAQWSVSAILGVSALASIFVMAPWALVAWVRLESEPVKTEFYPSAGESLSSKRPSLRR